MTRKAAVFALAFLLVCASNLVVHSESQLAWAEGATGATSTDSELATVTEVHGNVFRRPIVENISRNLGRTVPLAKGDSLAELMQVGTGPDSWCELNWHNIIVRIWGDTVIQIQPHQRVLYLAKGELLVRQKKDAVGKLTIWSPVLKARLDGTTVVFQHTPTFSRFSVLEGSVELRNLIDEAVLTLRPGVVYEVLTPFEDREKYGMGSPKRTKDEAIKLFWLPFDPFWENKPPQHPTDGDFDWKVEDQKLDDMPNKFVNASIRSMELFRTPKSMSSLSILDCGAIINLYPLMSKFKTTLDSENLIQSEFLALPPICHPTTNTDIKSPLSLRNTLFGKAVRINLGPSYVKFKVGKELGYQYSMPTAADAEAMLKAELKAATGGTTKPKLPPMQPPKKNYTTAEIRGFMRRIDSADLMTQREIQKFREETDIKYKSMLADLERQQQSGMSASVFAVHKAKIDEWKESQKPLEDKLVEKSDKFKYHLEYWKQQLKLRGEK